MFKKLLRPLEKYIDRRFKETYQKLNDLQEAAKLANESLMESEKALTESEKNQVEISQKITDLGKKVTKIEWERKASSQSQSAYISMLTSYTAHDLKNNLQNIDNILSFKNASDITEGDLVIFKSSLRMIRESLDKFSNLSLSSQDSEISTKDIASNVYHINLQELKDKKIHCDPPSGENTTFTASFFTVTTILNNIFINAIKALSHNPNDTKKILFNYGVNTEKNIIWFRVYDNAPNIPDDIKSKIFEYGVTSYSDGEGIGLSHVKDICDIYNGGIEIIKSDIIGYTKLFHIELPIGQE